MRVIKRFLAAFFVIFLLSSFSKTLLEYQRNIGFHEDYKTEYEKEKQRNNELKTMLVKTADAHEMEKIIRNKLNMSKANETVIILPNPTVAPTVITPTPQPVHEQWRYVFFKN